MQDAFLWAVGQGQPTDYQGLAHLVAVLGIVTALWRQEMRVGIRMLMKLARRLKSGWIDIKDGKIGADFRPDRPAKLPPERKTRVQSPDPTQNALGPGTKEPPPIEPVTDIASGDAAA